MKMVRVPRFALIDRLVRAAAPPGETVEDFRVSELRNLPYVVIIGEPGIGKTTVLSQEADAASAQLVKAGDLVSGLVDLAGTAVFIDALDEFRSEGAKLDKIRSLGKLLKDAKLTRWRIACRSEDWRGGADLDNIKHSTGGQPIVVAQLLPLSDEEVVQVLVSLELADPQAFVERTTSLGAEAFLRSPLSLKLLHKVVEHGEWPKTRHELFALAVERLAEEPNAVHQTVRQHSLREVIAAAENIFLVMLLSGKRGVRRSKDVFSASANDPILDVSDLDVNLKVVEETLDTSLFPGEGSVFVPMHRTVAEFLGGRALAKAVAGDDKRAALPLTRAIALLTGIDQKSPSELRGLFAWFTVHLSLLKMHNDAKKLIETDAATVLVYGDAAAFPVELRRTILNELDRDDPYFRGIDSHQDSYVASLAGEDLTQDFDEILASGDNGSHQLATVFDVLTAGTPLKKLKPRLWAIATDPTRPGWQRVRASDAWLNGAEDRITELYKAVVATPISVHREQVRISIATRLPPVDLSAAEIKSIIADFVAAPGGKPTGSLYFLSSRLGKLPNLEIFDVPVQSWLPAETPESVDLEHFLDDLLAVTIKASPHITSPAMWRLLKNGRRGPYVVLSDGALKALHDWLDNVPGREAALLEEIIDEEQAENAPWIPANTFHTTTHRMVRADLVRHVMTSSKSDPTGPRGRFRLDVALHMIASLDADVAEVLRQEILPVLLSRPDCDELTRKLATKRVNVSERLIAERDKARREKEAAARDRRIKRLMPVIEELREGKGVVQLADAARWYFSVDSHAQPLEVVGSKTNAEIREAIVQGWRKLLLGGALGVSSEALGELEGTYITPFEISVFAGLDQLLASGADGLSVPLTVAIATLRSASIIGLSGKRKELERWALERLNGEPSAGRRELQRYWLAAVDAHPTHIESFARIREADAHGAAVADALASVIEMRRTMPSSLLRSALRAAASRINADRILGMTTSALADPGVQSEHRWIWHFQAFVLDPVAHGETLLQEHRPDGGARLIHELRGHELEPINTLEPSARSYREAIVIRIAGPHSQPEGLFENNHGITLFADIVHRAIQQLAAFPEREAGEILAQLFEESELHEWRQSLRHARSQWARTSRERNFRFPSAVSIVEALRGGAPANARDLHVVLFEELRQLGSELRNGDLSSWKAFWNTTKKMTPRTENECRDYVLARLRDRLQRFRIGAALSEVRRRNDSRADILVFTSAGDSIPTEAKRHFNREIWNAPADQLDGYTETIGANGLGIYLVFWFGLAPGRRLKPLRDVSAPSSASELESLLARRLGSDLRSRIRIVVLDVAPGSPK